MTRSYQQVERSLEQLSLHRHIPSFRHPLHKIIYLRFRVYEKITLMPGIFLIPSPTFAIVRG